MHALPITDKEEELLYNYNTNIEWIRQNMQSAIDGQIPSPDCICDYSRFEIEMERERNVKAGDKYSVDVAAPGCGRIHYEVTRVEENGDVYGVCTSDYVMEFDENDVI